MWLVLRRTAQPACTGGSSDCSWMFSRSEGLPAARSFLRGLAWRGVYPDLSEPGSESGPRPFAKQHAVPDLKAKPGRAAPNRFYVYGVVARLGLLAASLEMERTDPNPEVY